ncbi:MULTISPECIES: hypothetical protein [unclassified Luteibacter]|uniref:DUF4279 domain-containing protein n=1 Tax=Lysobacterales TaxID=135614 RepID=UPI00163AB95F|nr:MULTISPECIES: hypothetical protein [unclassified Luteibacter]
MSIDDVSLALGAAASKATLRGTPRTRAPDAPVYNTTTWQLARKSRHADVSNELLALLQQIKSNVRPGELKNVDEAFVDVFMAQTVANGTLGSSIECELSPEALDALSRLGAPVRFSMCNVEP